MKQTFTKTDSKTFKLDCLIFELQMGGYSDNYINITKYLNKLQETIGPFVIEFKPYELNNSFHYVIIKFHSEDDANLFEFYTKLAN